MKIKDAPLVLKVSGKEKIPVSDGSDLPKTITTSQILAFIKPDNSLVSISLSDKGEMVLTYGEQADFLDGSIRESGEVVLEFNIE